MRKLQLICAGAALLALSACGGESTEDAMTIESDSGEYRIDGDSGESSMTIDTPEGEASMRAGANVEPNLPQGWSIYPGSEVQNAINVDRADGSGTMVTMMADASAEAILAHYRAQAEATGFPIEMELTTATSSVIGGQKSDGSTFSVSVVPGADGAPSQVQLTIALEP